MIRLVFLWLKKLDLNMWHKSAAETYVIKYKFLITWVCVSLTWNRTARSPWHDDVETEKIILVSVNLWNVLLKFVTHSKIDYTGFVIERICVSSSLFSDAVWQRFSISYRKCLFSTYLEKPPCAQFNIAWQALQSNRFYRLITITTMGRENQMKKYELK